MKVRKYRLECGEWDAELKSTPWIEREGGKKADCKVWLIDGV